MIVVMVHSHVTVLINKGNLLLQELNYCGYFYSGVIFRYHTLMSFCTCDRGLRSLYLSPIVSIVIRFICYIIVQ